MTDLGPNDTDAATSAEAAFTFTIAGDYKVCYKPAAGSYAQVASATLTVLGTAPTGYTDDGAVTTGGAESITFSGGTGLDLRNGRDAAKIVAAGDTCANTVAGGTSQDTDLGSTDTQGALNATGVFTATIAGSYKVCYKIYRGAAWTQVGTTWTMNGVVPTGFQDDGKVYMSEDAAITEFIHLHGGSGMNIAGGKDSLKVVDWHDACDTATSTAGGSSEVTDLGNDDANDATTAAASLQFNGAGSFKVCYKLYGGNYTQVGTDLLTVTTNSTPDSAYREISQNVSFGFLEDCHFWMGDIRTLLTAAYASTLGIYVGTDQFNPYLLDYFLHTACYDNQTDVGKSVITFDLTVHKDKLDALRGHMAAVTSSALANNISFSNISSPTYGIAMPSSSMVVYEPGAAHAATHAVAPMVWIGDGSVTIGSNESFTLLLGFGLRLGPGQDAMKAHPAPHPWGSPCCSMSFPWLCWCWDTWHFASTAFCVLSTSSYPWKSILSCVSTPCCFPLVHQHITCSKALQ